MSNELVSRNNFSLSELEKIGETMCKSGLFSDLKASSQAVVKILAGREMGFEPFTSINGVHIIQGKPVISANLMASALKRTNKYNYTVTKHDDNEVSIDFFEYREGKYIKIGASSFNMGEAQKAGLSSRDNWRKYPRNMLFARAMSNGIKWYCPDVLNGNTVYTPDELGATEDEDGGIIDITPQKIQIDSEKKETHNLVEQEKSKLERQDVLLKNIRQYKTLDSLGIFYREIMDEVTAMNDTDFKKKFNNEVKKYKKELQDEVGKQDINQ